jgi:fatty-acyl-CoA synthase
VNSHRDDRSKLAHQSWLRALERTAPIAHDRQTTLPVAIERLAAQHGDALALSSPEAALSYRTLAARANRYSGWALAEHLRAGDVVCLVMGNCPEYLAVWLGITRVGATVALINTHLTGDLLAHSLRIATPRHVIASAEYAPAVAAARAALPAGIGYWAWGETREDLRPIEHELAQQSGDTPDPAAYSAPSLDSRALFIYTSGTTGLPKAANVSHHRLMQWSYWFAGLLDTQATDRMYNCLPLYHSVGGIVATGATLVAGGTVVLRPRFSASGFWRDVREERCTLFQYIGELCRYLVNNPPSDQDRQHQLRTACGNGLRPEVWPAFQERFAIPRILEYYASTEGNFSLYNCEGEPGAIGRIPGFLTHRLPVAIVRHDDDGGEPVRNAEGRCVRCGVGEPGEAIGQIPGDRNARVGAFEGYADAEATSRKVLRDVFKAGDAWYRTGDLMRRDSRGFFYFVDRVGDTFRWKGENVSTAEVWSTLAGCHGVLEGVVYGVDVAGADGRAGMAAMVVAGDFDPAAFYQEVASRLPDYARPVFLRVLTSLEVTGTFKPRKQELLREGFDPSRVPDALYVADRDANAYVVLDAGRFEAILAGRLRL